MNHLRPEELSAVLDGALEPAAREGAERHLAECAACRDALAALASQDQALRSALEHDPGEAYFETFAARVEDRIRAAGLRGAQARLGREGAWTWLSSPRRLAWVGAVAAVIAGAGIVMLTSRPERSLMQSPEVLRHVQPPTEPIPPPATLSRDRATAKREASQEEASRPSIAAPPRGAENLVRMDERAREAAPAPAPRGEAQAEKSLAPGAAPLRAQATRRTAAGEDVPVKDVARFAPPPPPPASAEADLKRAKPQAAAPLEQQPSVSKLDAVAKEGTIQLCGQVMDARERPLSGATVAIADQGLVTTSGPDGRFCLGAAPGVHELSVMAVGYEPARHQVRVEGDAAQTIVALRPVSVLEPSAGLFRGGRNEATQGLVMPSLGGGGGKAGALAGVAQSLSARAESLQSAVLFDGAAAAWAKVVSSTRDAPRLDARYRLAEARFKAWQRTPTPTRARSARAACDAYLAVAPPGPPRQQVLVWSHVLGR
jgi:hypothetical protein